MELYGILPYTSHNLYGCLPYICAQLYGFIPYKCDRNLPDQQMSNYRAGPRQREPSDQEIASEQFMELGRKAGSRAPCYSDLG